MGIARQYVSLFCLSAGSVDAGAAEAICQNDFLERGKIRLSGRAHRFAALSVVFPRVILKFAKIASYRNSYLWARPICFLKGR